MVNILSSLSATEGWADFIAEILPSQHSLHLVQKVRVLVEVMLWIIHCIEQ